MRPTRASRSRRAPRSVMRAAARVHRSGRRDARSRNGGSGGLEGARARRRVSRSGARGTGLDRCAGVAEVAAWGGLDVCKVITDYFYGGSREREVDHVMMTEAKAGIWQGTRYLFT